MKAIKKRGGPIRNRARSEEKMFDSVEYLLKIGTVDQLTMKAIANKAEFHPKLIYLYFGGEKLLIKKAILRRLENDIKTDFPKYIGQRDQDLDLLGTQLYKYFIKIAGDPFAQSLMHYNLANNDLVIRKSANIYNKPVEKFINTFLRKYARKASDQTMRGEISILFVGINYLAARSRLSDMPFLGIDLNTSEGRKQISESIIRLIKQL